MKRSVVIGAAVALVAVGIAVVALTRGEDDRLPRDQPRDDADPASAPVEDEDAADDPFEWMDPPDRPRRRREREREGVVGVSGMSDLREDGRTRFEDMTPEEREAFRERRLARFRERVEIVSLGPTEPAITADDLLEPFRDARRATRECVRDIEGGRDAWRASRDEGRELTFDLDASGAFVPGSFSSSPPLPAEIAGCFEQAFAGVTTAPPGEDGARVSMQLPARRFSADGGVPRRRRGPGPSVQVTGP